MAVTDPDAPPHKRATMILAPLNTPGFELVRTLPVFHYIGEGGHAEVRYNDVRVPVTNRLGAEGAALPLRRRVSDQAASITVCVPSVVPNGRWNCSANVPPIGWRLAAG